MSFFSKFFHLPRQKSPGNPEQFSHTAWPGFNPGAAGVGLDLNWSLPRMGLGGSRVQKQFYANQQGGMIFQGYAPPMTDLLNGQPVQQQFLAGQGLSVRNADGTYSVSPSFEQS
jgi:hypothetical protein